MSRIGILGKLNIANVLERIELFTKTGLLVIKQDTQWVEFYCREGKLLCTGPIRTDATLGERLLQDGVMSALMLQKTMLAIGAAVPSETRIALTLMDMGFVKREELRAWTAQKTEEIICSVLAWTTGDIFFEENSAPPAERLLVALAISTLLASVKTSNVVPQVVVHSPVAQHVVQEQSTVIDTPKPLSSLADASKMPTLSDASQFFGESAQNLQQTPPVSSYISGNALLPSFENGVTTGPILPSSPLLTPPEMPYVPVTTLPGPPAKQVDTSFMRPDMVLVPANPAESDSQPVQITPEQWQLLTMADGHTTLQDLCTVLHLERTKVLTLAGQLVAEQIIHVLPPQFVTMQEMSPASRELENSGLAHGMVIPGQAATMPTAWGNVQPVSSMGTQFPSNFETQSQWGNGGNGAKFIPGQGWVASVQPLQPLQLNGFGSSGIYASVNGRR